MSIMKGGTIGDPIETTLRVSGVVGVSGPITISGPVTVGVSHVVGVSGSVLAVPIDLASNALVVSGVSGSVKASLVDVSSNFVAVAGTSPTLRVVQTDISGNLQIRFTPQAAYCVPVALLFTGATALGATVFGMRLVSNSTRQAYVRRIQLVAGFFGTTAGTTAQYVLQRFNVSAPSGGATITPARYLTTAVSTDFTVVRFASEGLTTTGMVVQDGTVGLVYNARNSAANSRFDFVTDAVYGAKPFTLLPGEGLRILLLAASVSGDTLTGTVEWEET